jgi:hypothetical protein
LSLAEEILTVFHPLTFLPCVNESADMDEHLEIQHFNTLMNQIGEPLDPYERPRSGRPDFEKIINDLMTGIEHTLLVTEEEMRLRKLQQKVYPGRFINRTWLRRRDKADRLSSADLGKHLTSPHNPCVMARNPNDRVTEYCELVLARVNKKQAILNQPDYPRFDRNWLLLVDLIGGAVDFTMLRRGLVRRDRSLKDFDRIYIKSGRSWYLWEDGDLRRLQTHSLIAS